MSESVPFMRDMQEEDDKQQRQVKSKNGIILGKDGKPCRQCNSLADFKAFTSSSPASSSTPSLLSSASTSAKQCPPDVEELGRGAWTLLHSLAAVYPTKATEKHQSQTESFLTYLSNNYPCFVCAEDFKKFMHENNPKVDSREAFGKWLCDAHNDVNAKLGKEIFDCNMWQERWKDGPKDGSCG